MENKFTYSILQYRHSFLTREAVNIGILFSFLGENKIRSVFGTSQRVKLIYPDFNPHLFNATLNYLTETINDENMNVSANELNLSDNFKNFISKKLLKVDSSSIQFTEPVRAISISDIDSTVNNYVCLLLPNISVKRSEAIRKPRKDKYTIT